MPVVTAFEQGGVRGFLHRPDEDGGIGLVLAHGAGGNCAAPLLVATATAFCAAGFSVLRCDLAFRQQRPSGPPSPRTAPADRASLREAASAMRAIAAREVILGGHSYGGRQATMLAAEEPAVADALLLFSYPLHPPGKPDQLRTGHFPRLRTPAVFVHGSTDPFGSLDELRPALALIAGPTRLIPVEGAGHDLRRGRLAFDEIMAAVLEWSAE